jgi:hypothetical protein
MLPLDFTISAGRPFQIGASPCRSCRIDVIETAGLSSYCAILNKLPHPDGIPDVMNSFRFTLRKVTLPSTSNVYAKADSREFFDRCSWAVESNHHCDIRQMAASRSTISALFDRFKAWTHEDRRKPKPSLRNTIAHEPLAPLAALMGLTHCGIFRTPCVISRREVYKELGERHPTLPPSGGGATRQMQIHSAGACSAVSREARGRKQDGSQKD